MPFYPINLQIKGRHCAVIGGGNVAERKVLSLLAAGAFISIFSPELTPGLTALVQNKRIIHVDRLYRQGDIVNFFSLSARTKIPADDINVTKASASVLRDLVPAKSYFIVICATDDPAVNSLAAGEARQAGALVNVVDDTDLGDFSVPAQVTHGDLLITVSTGGKSPALARRLREELAERYGPEYGLYLELISKARCELKNRLATAKERGHFWQQTLDREILSLLRQGKIKEAEDKIKHAVGCIGTQS